MPTHERTVYTTTELGAVLLYSFLLALMLIAAGFALGVAGLTAGGFVIIGAVMTVILIIDPAE